MDLPEAAPRSARQSATKCLKKGSTRTVSGCDHSSVRWPQLHQRERIALFFSFQPNLRRSISTLSTALGVSFGVFWKMEKSITTTRRGVVGEDRLSCLACRRLKVGRKPLFSCSLLI